MLFERDELRITEVSACYVLNTVEGNPTMDILWSLVRAIMYRRYFAKLTNFPILRNYSYVTLFVAWPQFHANPIFARCPATFASRSVARAANCGNGVS